MRERKRLLSGQLGNGLRRSWLLNKGMKPCCGPSWQRNGRELARYPK
jgi:hypothetical protein